MFFKSFSTLQRQFGKKVKPKDMSHLYSLETAARCDGMEREPTEDKL